MIDANKLVENQRRLAEAQKPPERPAPEETPARPFPLQGQEVQYPLSGGAPIPNLAK